MSISIEKTDCIEKTTRAIVTHQIGFYDLIRKYGSNKGLDIANILSAGQFGILTQERVSHLIHNHLQSTSWKQSGN